MKQFDKYRLLLAPVLLILLGLILAVNPDSASALISRLLGLILGIVAACFGFSAVASPNGRTGKVIAAITLAVAGGWLGSHPLALAAWIGRIIGILLLVNAFSDTVATRGSGIRPGFSVIGAGLGLVLVLLPLTASRLLFSLCGVAVLVVGVCMLLTRLKKIRYLDEPEDPNIIDAL